jgi:hypothetical protein
MKKTAKKTFNREVDTYRKALLYYARKRDWPAFEAKAGRMFDYVEAVERNELERRFYSRFSIILAGLVLAVVALLSIHFEVSSQLIRLKNTITFGSIMASTFELYFYINYRTYTGGRVSLYQERRTNFINGIETDFRTYFLKNEDGRSRFLNGS